MTEQTLFFKLAQPNTIIDITLIVKDRVNIGGKWNLDLLHNWFNVELVNWIMDIPHSLREDGVYRIQNGDYKDIKFSLGNAYKYLSYSNVMKHTFNGISFGNGKVHIGSKPSLGL